MKKMVSTFIRLFTGLFICALAIVFMVNANLGLSPWDALHQGISNIIGITMGTASIIVGFIIVIVDVVLGENVGWGTVLNMIFVGVFIDVIMFLNIVPMSTNFIFALSMLIVGMILMGLGMVLYLGSEVGSGPRDGMMIALQKRFNKPVYLIRGCIEGSALIGAYFLKGSIGIGTIITAIGLGYVIQIIFKICRFDSGNLRHRFIIDDINYLIGYSKEDTTLDQKEVANECE